MSNDTVRVLSKDEIIDVFLEGIDIGCQFLIPFDVGFNIFSLLEGATDYSPYCTVINKETGEEINILEFHSICLRKMKELEDLLDKDYITKDGLDLIRSIKDIGKSTDDPYIASKEVLALFDKKYSIFPTDSSEDIEYSIDMEQNYYPTDDCRVDISGHLADTWEVRYISKSNRITR